MSFMMIRNPGVADPLAFTLMGVSTTRNAGQTGTIGQFGSGSKFSIAMLLRWGVRIVIFCGKLRMEFFTKEKNVSGQTFGHVCVKYSGQDIEGRSRTSTEDLGFVAEMGVNDWNDLHMAMREFVANAIDGSICAGYGYKNVEMEFVDEMPRAKDGHTTVVIEMTDDFAKVADHVDNWFLHFGPQSQYLGERIIPKRDDDNKVRVYKKGVLVHTIEGVKSMFDYNMGDELHLDESRNARYSEVRQAISRTLAKTGVEKLASIMEGVIKDNTLFEAGLEYLVPSFSAPDAKQIEAFKRAFTAVAGPNGVATQGKSALDGLIKHKGYNPVVMPHHWHAAMRACGINNELTILTKDENEGKIIAEPSDEMVRMTDKVWALFEKYKQTGGKKKPSVKSFHSIMDGGTLTMGYCPIGGDGIYLHQTLGWGKMMFQTCLEEVTHYATGSLDFSRDIQDFLFGLIMEMVWDEKE